MQGKQRSTVRSAAQDRFLGGAQRNPGFAGTGYAHWRAGGALRTAQAVPIGYKPFFVVPLPHNETCGFDGHFFLACLFEYMF